MKAEVARHIPHPTKRQSGCFPSERTWPRWSHPMGGYSIWTDSHPRPCWGNWRGTREGGKRQKGNMSPQISYELASFANVWGVDKVWGPSGHGMRNYCKYGRLTPGGKKTKIFYFIAPMAQWPGGFVLVSSTANREIGLKKRAIMCACRDSQGPAGLMCNLSPYM